MNILPKKRWHVRTKDNIARVRRDEAQAADEEREKLRRAKLAEQEARTALLRQKARVDRPDSDELRADDIVAENTSAGDNHQGGLDDERPQRKDTPKKSVDAFSRVQQTSATTADIYTKEGNINFFKDLESGGQGTTGSLTNKDHEAEERAEKEKYEKQIGLLTYLGQDSLEASKSKAWYNDDEKCVSAIWSNAAKRGSAAEEEEKDGKAAENLEVGLKYKKSQDPLNDVIKYTGWKPIKSCPASGKDILSFVSDNESSLGLAAPSSSREYPVLAISDGKCDRKLKKMLKKKKKIDRKIRDHSTRLKRSSKKSKKDKIEKRNDDRRDRSQLPRRDKRKKSTNIKVSRKEIRESDSKKERRSVSHRTGGLSSSDSDERPSRKRRRNKHRSKSSRRSRSSSSQSSDSSSDTSSNSSYTTDSEAERRDKEEKRGQLERLRAERLAREASERKRAQRLLAGLDPNIEPPPPPVPGAARQKYSAQFNPLVARQNKEPLRAGVKYF